MSYSTEQDVVALGGPSGFCLVAQVDGSSMEVVFKRVLDRSVGALAWTASGVLLVGTSAGGVHAFTCERSPVTGGEWSVSEIWAADLIEDGVTAISMTQTDEDDVPVLAVGGADGTIAVFRASAAADGSFSVMQPPLCSYQEAADYISSFHTMRTRVYPVNCPPTHTGDPHWGLLATAGDGHIYITSLNRADSVALANISDGCGSDITASCAPASGRLSVTLIEGRIETWDVAGGRWGDPIDDLPAGDVGEASALAGVDRHTVVAGCADGTLRLVQVCPAKLVGTVGHAVCVSGRNCKRALPLVPQQLLLGARDPVHARARAAEPNGRVLLFGRCMPGDTLVVWDATELFVEQEPMPGAARAPCSEPYSISCDDAEDLDLSAAVPAATADAINDPDSDDLDDLFDNLAPAGSGVTRQEETRRKGMRTKGRKLLEERRLLGTGAGKGERRRIERRDFFSGL